MNYFAHALPFLERPYFLAGTGVPDWLVVADRRVRIRSKHAEAFRHDARPWVADVAGGVLQHLGDDARFHETRAFAETSLALTVCIRDRLGSDSSLRPAFLGHVLVELLLDAALIGEESAKLDAYYQALDLVDAARVETAVNAMAPHPTERLAVLIHHFRQERILWNYLEDDKLLSRLNQIMQRVTLPLLPDEFMALLPAARSLVAARKGDLLQNIPA
jgi:hypothetical protein